LTLRDNHQKYRLRTSISAAIIPAATPNRHPDCRRQLIQIVAT
jgi:hypothetical protein